MSVDDVPIKRRPDMTASSIRWLISQLSQEAVYAESVPHGLSRDEATTLINQLQKYGDLCTKRLLATTSEIAPTTLPGSTRTVEQLSSITLQQRYGQALRADQPDLAEQIKAELQRRGWRVPIARRYKNTPMPVTQLAYNSLKVLLSRARKVGDQKRIDELAEEVRRRRTVALDAKYCRVAQPMEDRPQEQ